MSKPKHYMRGIPYNDILTKWSPLVKGNLSYREAISSEYHFAFRKTWHVERGIAPWVNAGLSDRHVSNTKRRPVVQKRLKKLNKYLRFAWKGYDYGKHPKYLSSAE